MKTRMSLDDGASSANPKYGQVQTESRLFRGLPLSSDVPVLLLNQAT